MVMQTERLLSVGDSAVIVLLAARKRLTAD